MTPTKKTICPFCLEDNEGSSAIKICTNNHWCHRDCVQPWLKDNKKCPVGCGEDLIAEISMSPSPTPIEIDLSETKENSYTCPYRLLSISMNKIPRSPQMTRCIKRLRNNPEDLCIECTLAGMCGGACGGFCAACAQNSCAQAALPQIIGVGGGCGLICAILSCMVDPRRLCNCLEHTFSSN